MRSIRISIALSATQGRGSWGAVSRKSSTPPAQEPCMSCSARCLPVLMMQAVLTNHAARCTSLLRAASVLLTAITNSTRRHTICAASSRYDSLRHHMEKYISYVARCAESRDISVRRDMSSARWYARSTVFWVAI